MIMATTIVYRIDLRETKNHKCCKGDYDFVWTYSTSYLYFKQFYQNAEYDNCICKQLKLRVLYARFASLAIS